MWKSKNKTDLMIEIWESLDCESVGAAEIKAIEAGVRERFGESAVDSPMIMARLLADEGAELRHSEIMELYIERHSDAGRGPELRDIIDTSSIKKTLRSIRQMDNLRRKYERENDREGLRMLRTKALDAKKAAQTTAGGRKASGPEKQIAKEAAHWLTLWLQSPEIFESWVKLRCESTEFIEIFGKI